jgi:glycosyltransferase involved in cell wall biosynthesis
MSPEQTPHVTILLAIRDGGAALDTQLDSYLQQSLKPSHILASDDGSRDNSVARFDAFAHRAAAAGIRCQRVQGPRRGATVNFLSLLAQASPASCYVALSDQDDIWLPQKLAKACQLLSPHADAPALLGTRSWEWDSLRDQRHLSRSVPLPHDFRHALVQNFAGGNTMVLNRTALHLVQRALPRVVEAAVHDWWLYQLISGAGGRVILDPEPQILYRQHAGNQIGANSTLTSKLSRLRAMLNGRYRRWNDLNIAALEPNMDLLTADSRDILVQFSRHRQDGVIARLQMLRQTGLRRKGGLNQASLWLAALLGRL